MRTSGKGSIVLLRCPWWRALRDGSAPETEMIEQPSCLVVQVLHLRVQVGTPRTARKLRFHPRLKMCLTICLAHLPSAASALVRSSSCRFRVVERAVPASTGASPQVGASRSQGEPGASPWPPRQAIGASVAASRCCRTCAKSRERSPGDANG